MTLRQILAAYRANPSLIAGAFGLVAMWFLIALVIEVAAAAPTLIGEMM